MFWLLEEEPEIVCGSLSGENCGRSTMFGICQRNQLSIT